MKPTLALFPRDPNMIEACPECGASMCFIREAYGDWIRCTECVWRIRVPDDAPGPEERREA